ncbi:MAG: hypothetical protein OEL89_01345 [Candidatus Peregrinibacteria bacterium]|nr:hypothetical protein [Candidatus Peregrinibacteria bacterium]
MNKSILIKNIKHFGFTENEAKLYLAALECGTSPASKLGQKAGLNRVTAYGTCQHLLKKGIFTVSEIRNTQNFTAIDPEIFFEGQKNKMTALETSLPSLKALGNTENHHPTVQFFEGIDGIKQAYEITLKSKTEILSVANSQNIRIHWPEYDEEYVARRAKKKIFLRGIAPGDAEGKKVHRDDKKYYREIKLQPPKLFSTKKVENEINIFDDKVLIASFEPTAFAILIESTTVAETQRQIFELAWQ